MDSQLISVYSTGAGVEPVVLLERPIEELISIGSVEM